jgi:hypothetical protein
MHKEIRLMAISWDKALPNAVKKALTTFSEQGDCYLIANDVNERSITHKLGCYLQQEIIALVNSENSSAPGGLPRYKVDCEYDRYGPHERKWVPMDCEIDGGDAVFYTPVPDIITHDRGLFGDNLLVIEVKKKRRTDSLGRVIDKMKLVAYLLPPLRYRYGMFVCVDESNGALIVEEAKLVCEDIVKHEESELINHVWTPLHQMVIASRDKEGKIKFQRRVEAAEESKLHRLERELEDRCRFEDLSKELTPQPGETA